MALEMKLTSRWWYARFLVNGKLRRFPLMERRGGQEQRVEIKGRRPASLKHPEQGDAAFLESYHRARAAHDRLSEEELTRHSVEDLAQRIVEAKTGTRLDFVKVESVPDAWASLPRKRPPSPQYLETGKSKLRCFTTFMRKNHPAVEDLAAIRTEHVRTFLNTESARGVAPRTWNITLKLLKTVFAKLEPNADAYRTFLKNAAFKDEDTIHREPFNDEELDAILVAAREDEILRGPLVTALCTAMRRGDCCCLKWGSVDLGAGFIEVCTSKTGETAEIPILPLLRQELLTLSQTGGEYVFPKAAALYQADPRAVDRRLQVILARAGFVDVPAPPATGNAGGKNPEPKPPTPEIPRDELRQRGLDAITATDMIEAKRQRMKVVFTAYLDGKSLPAIAREFGLSKSTVSLHLHEIEDMLGLAVFRRPAPPAIPVVTRGALHSKKCGGQRLKRGSVRGWHSFRVTFVTRALSAGMPEEMVRRVTGHTAVDIVRKHYFKPGREEFRREFKKVSSKLLMNGTKPQGEQLRAIIAGMTAKTWRQDQARLLAMLDGKASS